MNLDDFIVPSSVASPTGITPPPSDATSLSGSVPQGIFIKQTNQSVRTQSTMVPPSSVPQHASAVQRGTGEFDYVQRRVRKTSIDERRVCLSLMLALRGQLLTRQADTKASSQLLTTSAAC